MLARSGRLPTSGDYAYEVKWDGFRAIVSTEGELRVRSRRGWDMTEHVGFLAELPVRAVLDGELVALDALWAAVCEHELEGVVAKKRSGRYQPGERVWIKAENRAYWRHEMEREGAFKIRRERQFV